MRIYVYNNHSNFPSNINLYTQSVNINSQSQSEKKIKTNSFALSPSMIRNISKIKKELNYFKYKNKHKNFISRNSETKSASLNNNKIISTDNINLKKKIPKMTKKISDFMTKYTPSNCNLLDMASYTTRTKSNLSNSKNFGNNYFPIKTKIEKNLGKKLPNFSRYALTERPPCREKAYLSDFKNDTRKLRYLKYINLNKTRDIIEFRENMSYNQIKVKCDLFLYLNFCKLLKTHILSLAEYVQFLHKALFPEQKKDYFLIIKIRQLKKDIRDIKDKIKKIQNIFEICLNDKIFLLCVKNHTLNYKNFTHEEQNIVFYDIWKLLYLNTKNNQIDFDVNFNDYIKNDNNNFDNFVSDLNTYKKRLCNNVISDNLYLNYVMDIFDMFNNKDIYEYYVKNNSLLNSKFNNQNHIFSSVSDFHKKFFGVFINIQALLEEDFNINCDINHSRLDYNNMKKLLGNMHKEFGQEHYILDRKANIQKMISNDNSQELKSIKEIQMKFKNNNSKISKKIDIIVNSIFKTNDDYICKNFLKDEKIGKKSILEKLNLLEKLVNFLNYYKKCEEMKNLEIYEKCIKKLKQEKIEKLKEVKKLKYKQIRESTVNKLIEKMNKCPYIQNKKINYLCKSELKSNNKYKKLFG